MEEIETRYLSRGGRGYLHIRIRSGPRLYSLTFDQIKEQPPPQGNKTSVVSVHVDL